jgi:uncharacterized repeat protein (TIGR01451 family)
MKVNFLRQWNRIGWTCRLLGCLWLGAAAGASAAIEDLSTSALTQIQSLLSDKTNRTPAQLKLDSHLIYAARQAVGQPPAPGVPALALSGLVPVNGRVRVDFDATVSPDLLEDIAQRGGTVRSSAPQFRFVQADVPLDQLEALAQRSDVAFIRREVRALTSVGALTTEGDTTHRAAEARTFFGVNGAGVNVGVLSDSVDYYQQSQASGDLPADLVILPGQDGIPGSGEGTAMLEIVHDLVPGSGLYFATAFGGVGGFAQNIINLQEAGCDVIVDDVFYFNESPFQDGPIAQAVNQVTAAGALFFSSAGNAGSVTKGTSGTWEGDFVDGGAVTTPVDGRGGVVHSFGANAYNVITQPGFAVTLFWADPLGQSTNDYDLFVLDESGQNIIDSSTTVQNGTQDPYEIAASTDSGQRVVVVKVSGEGRYLHVDTLRGKMTVVTPGTTKGHSSAQDAFSTAAVDVATAFPNPFTGGVANPVESFSSDGPRRMFFAPDGTPYTPGDFTSTGGIVRQKPDIAAADGCQTTVPGFNPFFGTSAAAPHAAGIAALLKSYNPLLAPAEVRSLLELTALDIEAPGVDRDSGAGLVMAYQLLEAAPSGANLVVVTNYLTGGNGNGVVDPNECNDLRVVLANRGGFGVTNIQATLSTSTPGVIVTGIESPYPDVPGGEQRTNTVAFQFSTSDAFICGSTIEFALFIKSDQVTTTNLFRLATGQPGVVLRYNNSTPVPIPDGSTLGAESAIVVSNFPSALVQAAVALHITHTWDADLQIQLISPNGITNTLSANNGGSGDNYGTGCGDGQRTTFDDSAFQPISAGSAPFVGPYRPDQPLVVFSGLLPDVVSGTWILRVVDDISLDAGILQCWSLLLTTSQCLDGGGSCPGSDLAVGIRDFPDPVSLGSNLTYTITVTNHGPRLAKGVVLSQQLPPSTIFVSATVSQGTISHGGGVVTANLGNLGVGAVATATVRVTPTQVGSISSLASVSAVSDVDFNPANNVATAVTRVDPPLAELALGLSDAPDPVLQGGVLTYSVSVTNNGPSTATGVTITSALPASVVYLGAVASQGSVSAVSNQVTCVLGTLTKGAKATLSVSVRPLANRTIVASAGVTSNQADPIPANNSATTQTVVGPAANLAVGLEVVPSSVVVGSNFTAFIQVTNFGPSTASGVVVNHLLPAGATVVNSSSSQGSITVSNNAVIANLGSLSNAATAALTVVLRSTNVGQFSTSATVSANQADPQTANNSVVRSVVIDVPRNYPLVPAGVTLLAESFSPPNGAVDIGETVTVELRLGNEGNVPAASVVGTLQSGGGVTSPSTAQSYGTVAAGGPAVGRTFTFTAVGENGGSVVATLALQVSGTNQPPVTYTFTLPRVWAFANTNRITIPDAGTPTHYPSSITVSGVQGVVGRVAVVLSNLWHTFPQDLDVLVTNATGERTVLMSDAGGTTLATNVTLTVDDGTDGPVSQGAQLVTGAYQPVDYEPGDSLPLPAPAAPYPATLAQFNGLNPNGTWSLFVADDTPGDQGEIAAGWSLLIYTITPVNQLTDLQLLANVTPPAPKAGSALTYAWTVTNAGPDAATSVVFSNQLPAALALVSATASQGSITTNGGLILGTMGDLPAGSTATLTVVAVPLTPGSLTNVASVAGSEIDVNPANNTVVVVSAVGQPQADAAILGQVVPEPVITGSNLTYMFVVTNQGPEALLDARLSNALPARLSFVSASSTQGTVTNTGNTVECFLGVVEAGASVEITIVAQANTAGSLTNVATVTTASDDPNPVNSTVSLISDVNNPSPQIVAAGAVITGESVQPANGAVDPGEVVTVELALENRGQLDTTNLVGTLLATGGVGGSSTNTYGSLLAGGAPAARSFTFTNTAAPGAAVVATLQLDDDGTDRGRVSYLLPVPGTSNYSSASPLGIPELGAASPYPSTITVSEVTGLVTRVEVTLSNLSHKFPDDLDILLVSPTGTRVMLMSDCGGGFSVTNLVLTFSDSNGLANLPDASALRSGTSKPTDYEPGDTMPPPAPGGVPASSLAALNGSDPNGVWSLFVADDALGDDGLLAGGWSLRLTTVEPAGPLVDLGMGGSVDSDSALSGDVLTYTLQVINQGPEAAAAVFVTNTLPAGFQFLSASASHGTCTNVGSRVICDLGTLSSGAGVTITLQSLALATGLVTNEAVVTTSAIDLNQDNNQVSISSLVQPVPPPLLSASYDGVADKFIVTLQGVAGLTYVIESTADFGSWIARATNTAPSLGIIKFEESPASANTQRYYRAYRAP